MPLPLGCDSMCVARLRAGVQRAQLRTARPTHAPPAPCSRSHSDVKKGAVTFPERGLGYALSGTFAATQAQR